MNTSREFDKYAVKHMGIGSLNLHRHKTQMGYINPQIVEERKMNITTMDVFSRLMADGIIYVGTAIDDDIANIVNAQLLFMSSLGKPINMYLNTPGGGVYAGLSMYDTMQGIAASEVKLGVTVTGMAASMGSILLQGGTKGMRKILPHSRVMIHQPMGGARGQVSDILITAKEIEKLGVELYQILANGSGKTLKQIKKDCDRDHWLTAEEAKAYGFIDEILYPKFK